MSAAHDTPASPSPPSSSTDPTTTAWARLRAVAVALLVVGAALAFSLVLTVAAFVPLAALGVALDPADPFFLVASLVPSQLAFAAVGALVCLVFLDGVPVRVPTRRDLRWVGLGLLGSFAGVVLLLAASLVVDLSPAQSVVGVAAAADPRVLLALAALSVLVVAPAEELLFRGAVQGRLRRTFGPAGGVALASLVFASLHAFNFVGGGLVVLVPLAALFVVGSVLGSVYERTGNLVVPMAVHALYNATLFLGTFALG